MEREKERERRRRRRRNGVPAGVVGLARGRLADCQ